MIWHHNSGISLLHIIHHHRRPSIFHRLPPLLPLMHQIRAPSYRKLQHKHAAPEHKTFVKVRSVDSREGEVWDPSAERETHAVHHPDDDGTLFGVAATDLAVKEELAWSEVDDRVIGRNSSEWRKLETYFAHVILIGP